MSVCCCTSTARPGPMHGSMRPFLSAAYGQPPRRKGLHRRPERLYLHAHASLAACEFATGRWSPSSQGQKSRHISRCARHSMWRRVHPSRARSGARSPRSSARRIGARRSSARRSSARRIGTVHPSTRRIREWFLTAYRGVLQATPLPPPTSALSRYRRGAPIDTLNIVLGPTLHVRYLLPVVSPPILRTRREVSFAFPMPHPDRPYD